MSTRLLFFMFLIFGCALLSSSALAQSDVFGVADTVTLTVEELEAGKWMIVASLTNDEELAAIDIPVKYTAGIAKVKLDSMTYAKGRIDFFSNKFENKDTTSQIVRFGGLAYLAPNKPPLKPGKGEIGRAYVSVYGDRKPGPFGVDSITVPPNATLMLVHKNATQIIPYLNIAMSKASEKAEGKTEGKKEE